MFTRVAVGRARVVREVRAAAPLMAQLRAPVTARGPWLTAVLNAGTAGRPVAVVVEPHPQGRPEAVAFLSLRRQGLRTVVTMLGDGLAPPGAPGARLLARDDAAAGLLAAGIGDLLGSLRRPRQLRLAGLPMGDPTARHLKARFEDAVLATTRTSALLDDLDERGPVVRSRGAAELERWLPGLVSGPGGDFRRAAARLHAAVDQLELAVIPGRDGPRAALLTLVDGADRRPWWGFADGGPLRTVPGPPSVTFVAPAVDWPPVPRLRRRSG